MRFTEEEIQKWNMLTRGWEHHVETYLLITRRIRALEEEAKMIDDKYDVSGHLIKEPSLGWFEERERYERKNSTNNG